MEQKKSPKADISRQRTTGFLLGLVLVLALFYVALEWNGASSSDETAALDLDELMHESELVPMSNEPTMVRLEERRQQVRGEQLNVVDDAEEQEMEEPADGEDTDGDDEEQLDELRQQEDEKALAAMNVDPDNPLNFHVVEDLPQYPGGAVEFMKWLTRNLRYPATARQQKTQGRVVAVFYVERDGSISGLRITQSLSPECDREALRVLRMMPRWQPGIQNDQPCRTKVCIPIVFKI